MAIDNLVKGQEYELGKGWKGDYLGDFHLVVEYGGREPHTEEEKKFIEDHEDKEFHTFQRSNHTILSNCGIFS